MQTARRSLPEQQGYDSSQRGTLSQKDAEPDTIELSPSTICA